MVLKHENNYIHYKKICYTFNVVSQVVNVNTCRRMNMSVASNILRQIHVKQGCDLYNLYFSKEINQNTMLVGIDVCHKGAKSIVGFCASINPTMSQYYSERIIQKRGQEIVGRQLTEVFKVALNSFAERNPKN